MKFSLPRDDFAQNVAWVARTIPARPATPILSGMKIEALDGALRLSAFDFETSARCVIGADVEEKGTIVVSGKMLNDIASNLPAGIVTVFLDGAKVIIKSGAVKFTLLSMPLSDYPDLPSVPLRGGQIDSAVFAAAIGQVAIAASRDDSVPVLTSVRIVINGEHIKVLSTDRYRLARAATTWTPDDDNAEIDVLIRSKVLHDAAKSVSGAGTVSVTVDPNGNSIAFGAAGRQITTLIQAGAYPDVERLFPTESPINAIINTADLRDAVKRVALVAEKAAPIRLAFTADGTVTLGAGDGATDAQASESLTAQVTDQDITVAFNPQFLLDGIGAIHTQFIRFSFTHPNKPVQMNGVDDQGADIESYQYLLVPIRALG